MSTPRWVAITPGDGRDLRPWLRELLAVHPLTVLIREPTGVSPHLSDDILRWGGRCVWHERTPSPDPGLPVHLTSRTRAEPTSGIWSQSCHSGPDLDRAFAHGAAWCTLSPVFTPMSKPEDTRPPLGPEGFLSLARGRPVLALGGMNPSRALHLVAAGASGVAAIGLFFDHATPVAAARSWAAFVQQSGS